MKKLNLNNLIKVKLSDYGKEIYYHQFDGLNEYFGNNIIEPHFPTVDEYGYSEFQLWDFMHIYGEYMKMGFSDCGIEELNIYIDEKDLKEV